MILALLRSNLSQLTLLAITNHLRRLLWRRKSLQTVLLATPTASIWIPALLKTAIRVGQASKVRMKMTKAAYLTANQLNNLKGSHPKEIQPEGGAALPGSTSSEPANVGLSAPSARRRFPTQAALPACSSISSSFTGMSVQEISFQG